MWIGIDGTGVADNHLYSQKMQSSFVRQLTRRSDPPYFRGPHFDGLQCGRIAESAMDAVRNAIKDKQPIFLTGYSRGGAIAIRIAQMIREEFPAVKIPAMALFGAVDREVQLDLRAVALLANPHTAIAEAAFIAAQKAGMVPERSPGIQFSVDTIPNNVVAAYHARRARQCHSRDYFGNCGKAAESPCAYQEQFFLTTHAGMGGVPFPVEGRVQSDLFGLEAKTVTITPQQEWHGSKMVRRWMWKNLSQKELLN